MPTPNPHSPRAARGLDIIYETEDLERQETDMKVQLAKHSSNNTLGTDFKENMLLSFYNWPKVESSSVI